MHPRPTTNELLHKLKEAAEAIHLRNVRFANPAKIGGELNNLNIMDSGEVWNLILALLKEIKCDDYAGGRPPQRSTEKMVEGKDLWAFAWDSAMLGKRMYLKFVLKESAFYYVSLHESKFPKDGRRRIKV